MAKEYTYEEALAIEEKRKAYRKKYFEANKDRIYAYHKAYNEAHPEKVAEYRTNYRLSHKDEMIVYRKARQDAINAALAKGPSKSPLVKGNVDVSANIVREAPDTTTFIDQDVKQKRKKKVE